MAKYVAKRIGLMFVSFFIIMTICFVLVRLLPNPNVAVVGGMDKQVEAMREAWGYNKPIIVQYGIYLKKVLTEFNWGITTSLAPKYTSVVSIIAQKLPATLLVNLLSIVVSIPLGILFGIYAALKKNKWQDQVISVLIMLLISVPSYVYAFLVQYIFAFKLGWFPLVLKSGTDWLSPEMIHSAILPAMSLSFGTMAGLMRYTRAELTETLTSEYMLLARTKGLTGAQATTRHALRNAMVPILPMILGEIVGILGGSLVIESIFAVPGVGKLYTLSISVRDYDMFLAIAMFYVFIGLSASILTDISYGFIDPRIRMGGGKNNER
ncbi:MAG: ABC transporter permease [Lachnospiraceae bacterium]|nr:ABC transporter permease [Lachnospiraceae bacterium]